MFKYKVFPVDIGGLVTLCALASDCDFDMTAYSSYAFGFVLDRGLEDDGSACTYNHPYLFTKDDSVVPFDGLYWNYSYGLYVYLCSGVTYDASTYQFSYESYAVCATNEFLGGCFTSLTGPDGVFLSFKLLTPSEFDAFTAATTFNFWALWDSDGLVTDAGALNGTPLPSPPGEEPVEEESVEEPKKKWFESKTAQVAIGAGLSVATIALLLLL